MLQQWSRLVHRHPHLLLLHHSFPPQFSVAVSHAGVPDVMIAILRLILRVSVIDRCDMLVPVKDKISTGQVERTV